MICLLFCNIIGEHAGLTEAYNEQLWFYLTFIILIYLNISYFIYIKLCSDTMSLIHRWLLQSNILYHCKHSSNSLHFKLSCII